MTEQKVRIKIRSFDHKLADQAVRQIVDAVERTGAIVVGPVPLPTRIEKFCVIRSPNIDKDSREQFEIRTHKRVIDVLQPSSKTIDALSQLDLASGVEIDIKL
jgi:small subunit ribosomal protein S10